MKNQDIGLIPHPFMNNDLTGKQVVILDPVSTIVQQLYNLHESGEDINSLIYNKYIQIGTSDLPRNKPAGVMCVSPTWKNTL